MGFVSELISKEEKESTNWAACPEYTAAWQAIPGRWTIDREKNVFLWRIKRRMPELPEDTYGLFWQGDWRIRVRVLEALLPIGEVDNGVYHVKWTVSSLQIPAELQPLHDEIEATLREAFAVLAAKDGDCQECTVVFLPAKTSAAG